MCHEDWISLGLFLFVRGLKVGSWRHMIVQRRYHRGCGRMMVRNAGLLFLFIIVF
jgi:hypothetical protein